MFRRRLPNIAVYFVSAIVDGDVKTSPLGFAPRFADEYEAAMKAKHQPVG
jgi:hypothetical protein